MTRAVGALLVVTGPPGAGKSTVARCIIRLIDPTSGVICINGSDIARVAGSRLRPLRRHFPA